MASEVILAKQYIFETLSGDNTVKSIVGERVFDEVAPLGSSLPLIIFSFREGSDRIIVGGNRLFTRLEFSVRGVYESIETSLSDAIESALTTMGASFEDAFLICFRVSPFYMTEIEDGKVIRYEGGNYLIFIER